MLVLLAISLLACVFSTASAEDGTYTVSIVTNPEQGPFRHNQDVQFSCVIDPLPPDPITYQWRTVERYHGNSPDRQIISIHYAMELHFPYCYYHCQVLSNGTIVGTASKLVEVQGAIQTNEPVSRSFSRGGYLALNVNVTENNYGISNSSLVWYHNDTELFSGDRHTITNDNTTLIISDMRDYDAGSYKVNVSYTCPFPVPSVAILSPVIFTVQENSVPEYNPLSMFPTHYISAEDVLLNISADAQSIDSNLRSYWFINGSHSTVNVNWNGQIASSSFQATYTDVDKSASAVYIGVLKLPYETDDENCKVIRNHPIFVFDGVTVGLSLWSIKIYRAPFAVILEFAEASLTQPESTTVGCTAVGGRSPELFNLTLWRGEQLLAQVSGDHLTYRTHPQSYGTYTCAVDELRNSSVLLERVFFQLLFTTMRCHHLIGQQPIVHIKEAILSVLGTLCQQCDGLHLDSIEDTHLNCNSSGAHFTAALIYSSPDGEITASILTNKLITWLLSEERPALMVNGTRFALSQQCPTQRYTITEEFCYNSLNINSTPSAASPQASAPLAIGVFFSGMISGVVFTVIIIALIICIRRVKSSHQPSLESHASADDKSLKMTIDPNQAYETVDTHYQTGKLGQNNEVIYDEVPEV